jgi:hypothetical protein
MSDCVCTQCGSRIQGRAYMIVVHSPAINEDKMMAFCTLKHRDVWAERVVKLYPLLKILRMWREGEVAQP